MFLYMIDKLPKIYSVVKSTLKDMMSLTMYKSAQEKWYTIDDSLLGGHSYSFFKSEGMHQINVFSWSNSLSHADYLLS